MTAPSPAAVAAAAPAAIVFRCARFARSVPCAPLPSAPVVSPHSAEWAAEQAQPGKPPVLADMSVTAHPRPGRALRRNVRSGRKAPPPPKP